MNSKTNHSASSAGINKNMFITSIAVAAIIILVGDLFLSNLSSVLGINLLTGTAPLGWQTVGFYPGNGNHASNFVGEENTYGRQIPWAEVFLCGGTGKYSCSSGAALTGTGSGTSAGEAAPYAALPGNQRPQNIVESVPLAYNDHSASQIASGCCDSQFVTAAQNLAKYYPHAVIRLGWEFDGNWFAWGAGAIGGSTFDAAYIRVSKIYKAVDSNFQIMLCGDANLQSKWAGYGVSSLLPYTDIVGMDVYDNQPISTTQTAINWLETYGRQTGKGVAIGEWGEWSNGDDPNFIQVMYNWYNSLPSSGPGALVFHSYFDSSPNNLNAFPNSKSKFKQLFGGNQGVATTTVGGSTAPSTTVSGTTAQTTTVVATTIQGTTSVPIQTSSGVSFYVQQFLGPTTYNFSTYSSAPIIPAGWTPQQTGVWSTSPVAGSSSVTGYAYGTSYYQGTTQQGMRVTAFPSSFSNLNNNGVPCSSSPYASQFTAASTILTVSSSQVVTFGFSSDDAMEIYYKPTYSSTWTAISGGSAWHRQLASAYGPYSVTLNPGSYNVVVLWENGCGPGVQALTVSNFVGTSTPQPTSLSPINFYVQQALGPTTYNFSAYSSTPAIPAGWNVQQTGTWSTIPVGSGIYSATGYSYGTPYYQGTTHWSMPTVPFPSALSNLNNGLVACSSSPYGSEFSLASTVLTIQAQETFSIGMSSDDAMEIYYKPVSSSSWTALSNGAAWHRQLSTNYGPFLVSLNPGSYDFAVAWENGCSAGLQSLLVSYFIGSSVATPITQSSTTTVPVTTTIQPSNGAYVPIAIDNAQTSPTPAPFQQKLNIPTAQYAQYANSAWTNVEFTSGNPVGVSANTPLQAWIESTNSTSTVVWINLPRGISANNITTVYMNFLPTGTSAMSSSGPTGEAPTLSSTYGANDNGAKVFSFYDNFAGTSLNANNWMALSLTSPNSITVNNGLTLHAQSGGANIGSLATYSRPFVVDSYASVSNIGTNNYDLVWGQNQDQNPSGAWLYQIFDWDNRGGSTDFSSYYNNGNGWTTLSHGGTYSTNTFYVATQLFGLTGLTGYLNYNTQVLSSSDTSQSGPGYLGIDSAGRTSSNAGTPVTSTTQWIRVRAYAPNGVMPSATLGQLQNQGIPTTSTISPTSTTVQPTTTVSGTSSATTSVTTTSTTTTTLQPTTTVSSNIYAMDIFNRIVSSGWGSAGIGGSWSLAKGSSSDISVNGNGGLFAIKDAVYTSAEQVVVLPGTSALDYNATFDVSFLDNVKALNPSYGGAIVGVIARYQNAQDTGKGSYRAELVWNETAGLYLRCQDDSGSSPPGHFKIQKNLNIDPTQQYSSQPYSYHVAARISGSGSSTTCSMKAWKFGTTEPSSWQLVGTDSGQYGPQSAGPVGVRASADLQGSSAGQYLSTTTHLMISNLTISH